MSRTAVTIGNFDGVHVGHAALVRRCREVAGRQGRVCVLAFDPHPMTQLKPVAAPPRISTFEQRAEWLKAAGADEVIRLTPDAELLGKTAEDFLAWLAATYAPGFVIEGDDFHFGKARRGNIATLKAEGPRLGFRVEVVPPVEVSLSDHSIVRASSSMVRWLLSQGRVADASRLLGRPYELAGVVVYGDRRGRTIGYPTANLSTECVLPADGVYAGEAMTPDGRWFAAAINVGTRPTFDGVERRLEAHLLDATKFGEDPVYNWAIRVRLVSWLRDDLKFDGVESLVAQIERDCARTRAVMGRRAEHTREDAHA